MAISPQQAMHLTPEELGIIATLEAKIDDMLSEKYKKDSSKSLIFTFPPETETNQRIVTELIRRYKAAGWSEIRHHRESGSTILTFIVERDYLFD